MPSNPAQNQLSVNSFQYSIKNILTKAIRLLRFFVVILSPSGKSGRQRIPYHRATSVVLLLSFSFLTLVRSTCSLALPVSAAEDELYFIHRDHLGSTTVITDEAGEVVSQRRYYPYGSDKYPISSIQYPGSAGEDNITEREYTSQIRDDLTSLYYYNARSYDPALGTFISADTADDQINRYSYTGNNPVMFVDLTGHRFRPPLLNPLQVWAKKLRGRYFGSTYRQEQLAMNPAYPLFERVPIISSLGLLGSAGLEATTGHPERAQEALAGAGGLLFPEPTATSIALDIAGLSTVISTPPDTHIKATHADIYLNHEAGEARKIFKRADDKWLYEIETMKKHGGDLLPEFRGIIREEGEIVGYKMELIEGTTLKNFEGQVPRELYEPLIADYKELHAQGFVHGDLVRASHPHVENIMVEVGSGGEAQRLRLIDPYYTSSGFASGIVGYREALSFPSAIRRYMEQRGH